MSDGILNFVRTIGKLKCIRREGWVTQVGINNPESVADHTFRTAILTMCISDMRGLNTDKLVAMALLHDVHEAIIGDYDLTQKKRIGEIELRKRETEAINNVFSHLPDNLKEKYRSLSIEFQEQETAEAKLVRQLDQLEMIFQALEYEKDGYDTNKLQVFWDGVGGKLEDPDLIKIFRLLIDIRVKKI